MEDEIREKCKANAEAEQRYHYRGIVPPEERDRIEQEMISAFLQDFPGTEVEEHLLNRYRQWNFEGDGIKASISSFLWDYSGELTIGCVIFD